MVMYDGDLECPAEVLAKGTHNATAILEHVFSVFNLRHPTGYYGRSLSVGDVVKLGEEYYLCLGVGFCAVKFDDSDLEKSTSEN